MSFLSCEEMLAAASSQKISLSEAILRSDLAESRLTEAHSREMMHHLWQVMQATSRDYDPAQRSRSGLSGGDAAKVEQAHQEAGSAEEETGDITRLRRPAKKSWQNTAASGNRILRKYQNYFQERSQKNE